MGYVEIEADAKAVVMRTVRKEMTMATSTETTKDAVEYEWHSTPQLWSAVRPGYDGAPDSGCLIGFGRTQEAAATDLREQEDS